MFGFSSKKPLIEIKLIHWDLHIQANLSTVMDGNMSFSSQWFGGRKKRRSCCTQQGYYEQPKGRASASLVRQRMETLLSFQHLIEQCMNLPVSPCPWQSFSSARSWLKSSWWAIQLSCKYHPGEYEATVFSPNRGFAKTGFKVCSPRSNLIADTQSFLVGGTNKAPQVAILTTAYYDPRCRTDKDCVCKPLNNTELLLALHVKVCIRCFLK